VVAILYFLESSGQQVSTIISKDKIVLGEQISLQIKVEGISQASIKQDFVFPDSINHIEILSDSLQTISNSTLIYNLTLTSFDSGYWQLPAFEMILMDNRKLVTESIGITVMPVDVSTLVDYHDIKDILEVNPENNWCIIAAITVLALISLFAFLWFHNNKSAIQETQIPIAKIDVLYNQFLQNLSKLEITDLTEKTSVVNIYKESSNAIRTFIDKVYQQNTSHLTTSEYMLKIKGKFPDVLTENIYFQFLRLSDAVKFAKYLPPVEETKAIFPALRNIASEVYQQNKAKN
jgi:hypothetical protein